MPPPQTRQVPPPGTQTEGGGDQHFTRPTLAVMGAAARAPNWVPRRGQTPLSAGFEDRERQLRCPQLRQLNGRGSEHHDRGLRRVPPILLPEGQLVPDSLSCCCECLDGISQVFLSLWFSCWKSDNQCRGEGMVLSLQNIRICKEHFFLADIDRFWENVSGHG